MLLMPGDASQRQHLSSALDYLLRDARTNESHQGKSRPSSCSFPIKGSHDLKLNPTAWIYVIIVDSRLCLISLFRANQSSKCQVCGALPVTESHLDGSHVPFFPNSWSCAHFIISFAKSWAKLSIITFVILFWLAVSGIHLKPFCCFEIWVLFLWVYSSFLSVRETTSLWSSWGVITSVITLLCRLRHQTTKRAVNNFYLLL